MDEHISSYIVTCAFIKDMICSVLLPSLAVSSLSNGSHKRHFNIQHFAIVAEHLDFPRSVDSKDEQVASSCWYAIS